MIGRCARVPTARARAKALLDHEELDAEALGSILEEVGCARDDAPIRRVVLQVRVDLLRERHFELRNGGDSGGEMEELEKRIADTARELDELSEEEA